MYFSDRIKLRTITTTHDADGFAIQTATSKEVWADRHSVTRTEFYAAQGSRVRTDIGFTVKLADYSGQTEIEYKGIIYDVVRSFELDLDTVDLTCARR